MTENTFTFQAETQQLLQILIHSLYTEREIFLRELISNASDALNRVQFEQLTNEDLLDPDAELKIRVTVDEDVGTLTISDTGVGMTAEEMKDNLGTIARSGAKAFIEAMQDAKDSTAIQDIIGQFGVGFYSVFMVADKVEVVSRSYLPDAEAVKWTSDGSTTYTIESVEKDTRGTDIIVYLKEDSKEFAQEYRISDVIRRHSDYVVFPIYVGENEEPANKQVAIWRQASSEVEEEEYDQFYHMLTMDFQKPLRRINIRADVPMQFYALLYIPSSREPNPFSPRPESGLKLYARKILIQEFSKDLLPEYLQFVQGVVDSEDLPLNVSRETVQVDRIMVNLKKAITRKVLSELKRMARKEREDYLDIFAEFGGWLKQGLMVAPEDKDDLTELLVFNTTYDDNQESYHSLQEYVDRMVTGQEDIYYVIADDFTSARRSPHLDAFRQRGIEVLYFTDPVDSVIPMGLIDFEGHNLRSVDEADIDLREMGELQEDEGDTHEALAEDDFNSLRQQFASVLGERVKEVRESKTLVGSPARLVSDDGGASRYMYRINRALDREFELPVKSLELNPRHPLMHNLKNIITADSNNPLATMVIEQVFEDALLQDGIHPDPASMVDRLNMILQAATGTPMVDLETDGLTDQSDENENNSNEADDTAEEA